MGKTLVFLGDLNFDHRRHKQNVVRSARPHSGTKGYTNCCLTCYWGNLERTLANYILLNAVSFITTYLLLNIREYIFLRIMKENKFVVKNTGRVKTDATSLQGPFTAVSPNYSLYPLLHWIAKGASLQARKGQNLVREGFNRYLCT